MPLHHEGFVLPLLKKTLSESCMYGYMKAGRSSSRPVTLSSGRSKYVRWMDGWMEDGVCPTSRLPKRCMAWFTTWHEVNHPPLIPPPLGRLLCRRLKKTRTTRGALRCCRVKARPPAACCELFFADLKEFAGLKAETAAGTAAGTAVNL